MTARPILMRDDMVRAILREIERPGSGKTQTRRVLKPQPVPCVIWREPPEGKYPSEKGWSRFPYAAGDLRWIRETWGLKFPDPSPEHVIYRADHPGLQISWKPSIHMPKWASRLTLRVTDVRVQRVQDISEADARAEGIYSRSAIGDDPMHPTWTWSRNARRYETPTLAFAALWNTIHGPGAWERNDWVAAATFTPIHANVDRIGLQVPA